MRVGAPVFQTVKARSYNFPDLWVSTIVPAKMKRLGHSALALAGRELVELRNPHREDAMKILLMRLWEEDEGQDLTEYALLLVLISLIAVASLRVAGQAVSDAFSNAAANLTTNT
jgi:Flp pilus assembly pilin Flp